MITRLRRRAPVVVCLAFNALMTAACLVAHVSASSDRSGDGTGSGRDASGTEVVLRARLVDRLRDDPVARLFQPPRRSGPAPQAAQPQAAGSEPVRLVGIIASERADGPGLAVVELADHRTVRLRARADTGVPGLTVDRIGRRSIELTLESGRRVMTLN